MRHLLLLITSVNLLALEPCVKCHFQFQDRQVVRQKQAVMIRRIQTNQMPPGKPLTEAEKRQLIARIQQVSKSN